MKPSGGTKALVVGYGSIGTRHARILKSLDVPCAVLSSRLIDFKPSYRSLKKALRCESPNYVVVANRTSERLKFLKELESLGFRGTVLAEKPLFHAAKPRTFLRFKRVVVGYNLRFHPVLRKLKKLLSGERVVTVQCYVGKHLSLWRPQTNYRRSYSARRQAGGGVLRDLSHELDYLLWLFGRWKRLTASGGHWSKLKIDSDDTYALMIEFEKCPIATLQMNYLDQSPKRELVVITDRHSFKADLLRQTLEIDGKIKRFRLNADTTYKLEHEAMLKGDFKKLCSYKEGIEVLKMIDAAEKSAKRKAWVS